MACTSYCSNTKIPSLFIAEYIVSLSMSATAKIKKKKVEFPGCEKCSKNCVSSGKYKLRSAS
jgi:hypothetical protein